MNVSSDIAVASQPQVQFLLISNFPALCSEPRQRLSPGGDRLLAPVVAGLELVVGWPVYGQDIVGKRQFAAKLLKCRNQVLRFGEGISGGLECGHDQGLLNPTIF